MLSANVGDGAIKPESDPGHNDAIAKPFSLRQLIEKLGTQLQLEWEHEGAGSPTATPHRRNGSGSLQSPGAEHVRELISLGQIGHVRGIDAKLTELSLAPENGPLVDVLRARMEAYDFAGYTQILEGMNEHD
jgi:hypothetical protein